MRIPVTLKRFAGLFGLWLVISLNEPSAWIVGALASGIAAAMSLRLLPPGGRVTFATVLRVAPAFAWGSLLGGLDVAWRALHPRCPIQPQWLAYPVRLPAGAARVFLSNELSLVPGTLAAGTHGDLLHVHCLDRDTATAAQIVAAEERIAAGLSVPLEKACG